MFRNIKPVCLVKILAKMFGFRMILRVNLYRQRPMVRGPNNVYACTNGAQRKPSTSCEEIHGLHASPFKADCPMGLME